MNTNNLQNDLNQISNSNMDSDEISLKELILKLQEWWSYFLSKWVIILIAGTIGGIAGVIYAFSEKTVFWKQNYSQENVNLSC